MPGIPHAQGHVDRLGKSAGSNANVGLTRLVKLVRLISRGHGRTGEQRYAAAGESRH